MKNYFDGVTTMQALKARYKELAKMYHPDLHPDMGDAIMQQVNAQYDELAARFAKVAPDGRTQATEQEQQTAQDVAAAYREIIVKLLNLDGIEIELCGLWLWISGETRKHKDAIKAAGCYWSAKKSMWYWRPAEAQRRHNRRSHSMEYIRERYGSAKIIGSADSDRTDRYAIAAAY